jgi:elongation factor 1-beta
MGQVIATLRVMPDSVDVDLAQLEEAANAKIKELVGEPAGKVEQVPVAFGLKALDMTVVIDENGGGLDPIEEGLKTVEGVQSVEVTHLDRTF